MPGLRSIVLVFLVIGAALGGCGESEKKTRPSSKSGASLPRPRKTQALEHQAAAQTEDITADEERPEPFPGSAKSGSALLTELKQSAASPQRFRPIGGSSVVLRVELKDGVEAAFKPTTEDRATAYQREIAAFQLASVLGLDNVPPVVLINYGRDELQAKFHKDYNARWPEIQERILWDGNNLAEGALIAWISQGKSARFSDLESGISWTRWLLQGETAPSASLARDLSNMLAFDYLIGNWDRFSGGNFKMTDDNSRLILLDHNSAFGAPFRDKTHQRVYQRLRQAQKFSRSLYERLLSLDKSQLQELFRQDASGAAWLSAAQIDGLLDRRVTLLSYIQSLIELHGIDKILVFE